MSEIADRDELRAYLWEACEIEHQLMLQYLFAAFTLKKRPDATCTPAQLEYVRRWGSQVMMVARQEMEHLALANGILSAIGEAPFFARENIPVQSPYLLGRERVRDQASPEARGAEPSPVPCDIPFVFERFSQATVERFVCAESPAWADLEAEKVPLADWCFGTPERPCRSCTGVEDWREGAPLRAGAGGRKLRLARSHLPRRAAGALTVSSVHPGSIQEVYTRIRDALHTLPGLFVGDPARQVFIPVEYQINVTPVVDVATADAAIDLIVEEGEGIQAPPGFQSHYVRFFTVRDELVALRERYPGFEPALPVISDPTRGHISARFTREVFDLFDEAYATLLFVLAGLYRGFDARSPGGPSLGTALQNAAFGPFMTMVLRPIAEVLVQLRVEKGGRETAGPGFHLRPQDERLLRPRPPRAVRLPGELRPGRQAALAPELGDIEFFLGRMGRLLERLESVSTDRALRAHLLDAGEEEAARGQLRFVLESVRAMTNNMRRIYQVGEIPQFVLS
jgi:hypothetical protein